MSMDGLIKIVNQLQDAFSVLGQSPLDLPQIAVVGGQSAGKSSVLENIVGRDFLPRGSGIVTRRPLVLKLCTEPALTEDYAEFLHLPGQKFTDWAEVRKAIETATENEPGCQNKGISNKPINLSIFSPTVLNLTLIDLPGMTRVAVGDQPKDINDQIKAMLMHYITQENTIILAVSPANQDLANSDAVQLALSVDPEGHRTVGVLTKLDLMDRGTDALAVLNNEVIPLKLGYIPVVNRSQHDINTKKDLSSQWDEEKKYFSTHAVYGSIAERCGTQFLVKTLNATLIKAIKSALPDITTKIHKFMTARRAELALLQELGDANKKSAIVLNSLVEFNDKFKEMIEGRDDDASTAGLAGGAKLATLFSGSFESAITGVNVLDDTTPAQLRNIIRNSSGLSGGVFIPDQAFSVVIRRSLKRLESPSLNCMQLVYDELMLQAMSIETGPMTRYTVLADGIRACARTIIDSRMDNTRELVQTLIEMEVALINTNHPDFNVGLGGPQEPAEPPAPSRHAPAPSRHAHSRSRGGQPPPMPHKSMPTPPPRPAGGNTGAIIEGWLERKKRNGMMASSWSRRFCVVRNQSLVCSRDETGVGEGLEDTPLNGSTAQFVPGDLLCFTITSAAGKACTLRCPDGATAQKWMQCLQMASSEETWALAQTKLMQSPSTAVVLDLPPPPKPPSSSSPSPSPSPSSSASAWGKSPGRAASKSMSANDIRQTQQIEALLISYFGIVRKKIMDSVPKAITLKLINQVVSSLQTELVGNLYSPDQVDTLLSETADTANRRERLIKTLALMDAAVLAIGKVQRS